jgi:hypothetical protein
VFRDVIFDVNGHYHVAVPLNIPKSAPNYAELQREAHRLANLCYALEGQGILARPVSFVPPLVAQRQLKRRGSKFVECYGLRRPARYRRSWDAMRSVWSDTAYQERPAFKVYRFKKGAWPEMILGAVMGASRHIDIGTGRPTSDYPSGAANHAAPNGHAPATSLHLPELWNGSAGSAHAEDPAYGRYQRRYVEPEGRDDAEPMPPANGHELYAHEHESPTPYVDEAVDHSRSQGSGLVAEAPLYAPPAAAHPAQVRRPLMDALARLIGRRPDRQAQPGPTPTPQIEPERIAGRFGRSRNGA